MELRTTEATETSRHLPFGDIFFGSQQEWWAQVQASMLHRRRNDENVSSDEENDENLTANKNNLNGDDENASSIAVKLRKKRRRSSTFESGGFPSLPQQADWVGDACSHAVMPSSRELTAEEFTQDENVEERNHDSTESQNMRFGKHADFSESDQGCDVAHRMRQSQNNSLQGNARKKKKFRWEKILTAKEALRGSVWSPASHESKIWRRESRKSQHNGKSYNYVDEVDSEKGRHDFGKNTRIYDDGSGGNSDDQIDPVDDILILVGGVNGGVEGPAGLYHHMHYLARTMDMSNIDLNDQKYHHLPSDEHYPRMNKKYNVPSLAGWSVLSLNTGHSLDDAIPVIRAGIRWVLEKHPLSKGRLFLGGCSMGASTIIAAATLFGADVIAGLCILCGEGSHHQNLEREALSDIPVLLIHGANDIILPVQSCKTLCMSALISGAEIDVFLLRQRSSLKIDEETYEVNICSQTILKYHHMWDERFTVASLIIQWLNTHSTAITFSPEWCNTPCTGGYDITVENGACVQHSSFNVIDIKGRIEHREVFSTLRLNDSHNSMEVLKSPFGNTKTVTPHIRTVESDKVHSSRIFPTDRDREEKSTNDGSRPNSINTVNLTAQPHWETVPGIPTKFVIFERQWSCIMQHITAMQSVGQAYLEGNHDLASARSMFVLCHTCTSVLLAGVLHQKNSFCKGIALLIEAEEKISDLIRQLLEVPSWANVSSATGGNTRKNSDYCDIDDSSRIALSNERTDKVDSVTARTEMVLLPCYYEYALREMHAYEKDNCKRNCKQNTMDYERNLKQYSEPSTTWMICLQHREKLGDLLADLAFTTARVVKGNRIERDMQQVLRETATALAVLKKVDSLQGLLSRMRIRYLRVTTLDQLRCMSATLRECEEAMQEVMPKYEHFGTPLEEDISDEQRLVQMQVMHALQYRESIARCGELIQMEMDDAKTCRRNLILFFLALRKRHSGPQKSLTSRYWLNSFEVRWRVGGFIGTSLKIIVDGE